MPEIVLARHDGAPPTDAEREAARRVLFGFVDGLGEENQKRWRRFLNGLLRLQHGQTVEIRTNNPRVGKFHRLHMAMEQRLFESQEKFTLFEQFRNWLKIGAGHVDWVPGPRGAVVPVPKSISYADLEEGAFREFHDNMVKFFREPHAQKVLWPHLDERMRELTVETIFAEFEQE